MSGNFKDYGLNLYWKTTGTTETFYFESEQTLKNFINVSKDDILISRTFKIIDVDLSDLI